MDEQMAKLVFKPNVNDTVKQLCIDYWDILDIDSLNPKSKMNYVSILSKNGLSGNIHKIVSANCTFTTLKKCILCNDSISLSTHSELKKSNNTKQCIDCITLNEETELLDVEKYIKETSLELKIDPDFFSHVNSITKNLSTVEKIFLLTLLEGYQDQIAYRECINISFTAYENFDDEILKSLYDKHVLIKISLPPQDILKSKYFSKSRFFKPGIYFYGLLDYQQISLIRAKLIQEMKCCQRSVSDLKELRTLALHILKSKAIECLEFVEDVNKVQVGKSIKVENKIQFLLESKACNLKKIHSVLLYSSKELITIKHKSDFFVNGRDVFCRAIDRLISMSKNKDDFVFFERDIPLEISCLEVEDIFSNYILENKLDFESDSLNRIVTAIC